MPKKGGKKTGRKSTKTKSQTKSVLSEGYLIKDPKPIYVPLPGENLLKVLTTHPVGEKEVYNMVISSKALKELIPEEIKDLKMVFDVFDSNNDGFLSIPELRMSLRALGFKFSSAQAEELMELSTNGIKIIDFNGFLNCVIENQKESRDTFEEMMQGFKYFDLHDTGFISLDNLKTLSAELNVPLSVHQLQKMINEADINGDGVVSEEEFVKIMTQTNLFK